MSTIHQRFIQSTDPYKTVSQSEAEFCTALVEALVLSITALTDEKAKDATKLAEFFASRLSKKAVEQCKQKAKLKVFASPKGA